jgi:hypothetical protein
MLTEEHIIEQIKCRCSPWYFLTRYVKTLDRERGEQAFPDFPYLKELVTHLQYDQRLVILKSRQMLVTWTAAAFALWEAIFPGNADILFLSKREGDALEAVRRIKFIVDRLPWYLTPERGENTKNVLEFPKRCSRLMALPTGPNIGRTFSPTGIIWDEMASTPYDDELFTSLQPALDGGGYFVGISTSHGPMTKHAELYQNADTMGFTRVALHYSLHPLKNEQWRLKAQRGMSEERWQMEQEMALQVVGNRVYPAFQKSTHMISDFTPDNSKRLYRSIDFGYRTPVVLWGQLHNGNLIIFSEWIGENATISEMVRAIIAMDEEYNLTEEHFEVTFCDPAGAAQTDQGISSVERLKVEYRAVTGFEMKIRYRPSSVLTGIDIVREKLKNAANEISLFVSDRCSRTIADFGRYVKKKGSEEPKKDGVSEHTMDALRYMVINIFQKPKPAKVGIMQPRVSGMNRQNI